ncbi:taurine ABC transporter ATP-binding protein [Burkholderia multivorans]|uniref:taurine ABC transporter ATP-binding protein n=1 Tax=Burkholderia multivorans TaxID=87883 RepID=UPI0021C140C4|nr:ATP-binding cassette domain-containing protein [Burkholderia multivorans]MDR8763329.1 Taurine import ATP-binding protein TauB [Burkholderia multivorans]MDR8768986.1 Taurine import ATP-binding protein TauB [Burkholderia multivorans]MDR8774900.1 Taurine import ATP-binding protein TauB [Burkholderia multivorans]MDR8792512.1 Taurine import ATP-binding protein TauB [Burkholderia multivorans]MDR8798629.1 Taurine import ATP-binding protein TauB [Burkholderia multivorans]
MIRIDSVGADFDTERGRHTVLSGIDLELRDGSFTVVLGASGCGKTTLLNVIAGFIAPSAGQVTIDGVPITGPGADRGVVSQDDALLPWQNVEENIGFGLTLAGASRSARREKVAALLELTGLADYAHYPLWKISGGMRQRVGLARALAVDPRYLLLDEPLGALDALTRVRMQEYLLSLWIRYRKGVLMITHDITEALFMATDLVLMRGGPGRIESVRRLGFNQRFVDGESSREIKNDPEFVRLRDQIEVEFFTDEKVLP